MHKDIKAYNQKQPSEQKSICELLAKEITKALPEAENKIWHGGPVWFLDGNPVVGYWARQPKSGSYVGLMFWSGADFKEANLQPGSGKFKDASIRYTDANQVDIGDLKRWLEKAKTIQWDYKNIIKHRGVLTRLDRKGRK